MFTRKITLLLTALLYLGSCAQVDVPGPRNLKIPQPTQAGERKTAINERPDAVMYLPLGKDVLIPEVPASDKLPGRIVGPFELRGETLAGALQLITSDFNIPMAFESEEALTRKVTVSNMKGPMGTVVNRVCSLADLYCSYEEGALIVKDTQTFTVSVPPVSSSDADIIDAVASGIQGITGLNTITDLGTRTIIYEATQRSADLVERYFQRMRRSTALVIFEMYIWEVSLDNGNATGVQWDKLMEYGKFSSNVTIPSSIPADFSPISIGLPTAGDVDPNDIVRFISEFGAVKTISQPQITMLSGSDATLRAADTINYVSSLQRTVDNGEVSVSTETDSVDTGFTLEISANWDHSTVYSDISIQLQEFKRFETFGEGTETELQLPETTEREVTTQVRIRPGDSLLLAGLVRETDQYAKEGPGFRGPLFPTSRSAQSSNVELVFLMKPRVVIYTTDQDSGPVSSKVDAPTPVPNNPPAPKQQETGVVGKEEESTQDLKPTIGTLPLDLLNPN
ncbi:MAG: type II and III secretion system family protein [Rhodospirillales bacterium]|nr:type II and III secretion system family protein [Rhodospirillales bacterium]MCB9965040.1 type II and III secretion system family protein [Rhodospirillales bacterium]MCB9980368.1 type II and III secretion system family protein [Rhodospirillales bacterium]